MLKVKSALSFFILVCLFYLGFYDTSLSRAQNQARVSVNDGCNVRFDPKRSEIKLVSKITVNAQSQRARCIVRINAANSQKQLRLVSLALKGSVKKAPATVAISLFLIGDKPTSLSKKYTSPTKFDLSNQISKTNYTTNGVFGINLVLMTTEGELELTDMRFALQQR